MRARLFAHAFIAAHRMGHRVRLFRRNRRFFPVNLQVLLVSLVRKEEDGTTCHCSGGTGGFPENLQVFLMNFAREDEKVANVHLFES
ncbi:hypothetical protein PDUR_24990 [Paenibacillus durus]|uniref:Uncharacterized protein n=1 Tax=Paenibacillus durus TaxID=44251 RepID=A0A089J0Q1_PAEDU|nr:hypothetical protein PDUR_24990 [Paenibacillus durus]